MTMIMTIRVAWKSGWRGVRTSVGTALLMFPSPTFWPASLIHILDPVLDLATILPSTSFLRARPSPTREYAKITRDLVLHLYRCVVRPV
jgi:hypothetical protein